MPTTLDTDRQPTLEERVIALEGGASGSAGEAPAPSAGHEERLSALEKRVDDLHRRLFGHYDHDVDAAAAGAAPRVPEESSPIVSPPFSSSGSVTS